ncbi:MAG: hypothetical protein ACLUJG_08645 [Lawsonibacter sp.]
MVMILPTIIRTTQESLKTVPRATGRVPWARAPGSGSMIRTGGAAQRRDGIVTGCILAVAVIVGESAALLVHRGLRHRAA